MLDRSRTRGQDGHDGSTRRSRASTLPREEVLQRLDEASVPTGSHHLASHLFGDPQYGARNMVQELPVGVAGEQQRVAFAGVVPALDRSCSCRACPLDHEETL